MLISFCDYSIILCRLFLLITQMMLEEHKPMGKIQKYTGYTVDKLKEIEKTMENKQH